MLSKGAQRAWWGLSALLTLALWLVSCGRVYVKGPPLSVLEGLCQALGLTYPQDGFWLYYPLTWSPLDPVLSASLLQALALTSGFVLLWLSLSKVWDNPVSPTLFCGLAFFGSSVPWLLADTPEQALGVFFKATALGAIVAGKIPILCAAVVGVTLADPAAGVSLLLVLLYLGYRRQEAYGPLLTGVALVGTSILLVGLAGDYQLHPSLSAWTLWSGLPVLALAFNRELRASRLGLYALLLGSSLATGSSEYASAICLGDVALLALRHKPSEEESQDSSEEGEGWRLSRTTLTQAFALLILIAAVLKGEQYLNRSILIPSQKQKIALHNLFLPFSLQGHAERVESGNWRGLSPLPSLQSSEFQAAQKLQGPFRVLTLDHMKEERGLSLALALYSGKALEGWASPQHLSTASLSCKAARYNAVVGSTALIRDGGEVRLEPGPELPEQRDRFAAISFRELWALPLRAQTLSQKVGAGYKLRTEKGEQTLFFPKSEAILAFSPQPEEYLIEALDTEDKSRKLRIEALELSLEPLTLKEALPSRTLVKLPFRLKNLGRSPISTRELTSVTLHVERGASFSPAHQEWPFDFVLFPEESIELSLLLPTPAAEGDFRLTASVETSDRTEHKLPLEGDGEFHSWRRLAPVGTWVEEP